MNMYWVCRFIIVVFVMFSLLYFLSRFLPLPSSFYRPTSSIEKLYPFFLDLILLIISLIYAAYDIKKTRNSQNDEL